MKTELDRQRARIPYKKFVVTIVSYYKLKLSKTSQGINLKKKNTNNRERKTPASGAKYLVLAISLFI